MRIDPQMSDPLAIVVVPAASDPPAPPEDPPVVNSGFHGFRETPHSRECVTPAQANSGDVDRACTMPPAFINRSMLSDVDVSIASLKTSDPAVVRLPLILFSSLTASGSPSNGRTRATGLAYLASAFFA